MAVCRKDRFYVLCVMAYEGGLTYAVSRHDIRSGSTPATSDLYRTLPPATDIAYIITYYNGLSIALVVMGYNDSGGIQI